MGHRPKLLTFVIYVHGLVHRNRGMFARAAQSLLSILALVLLMSSARAADRRWTSDRMTVITRGKGADVILIPGLACSSAVWDQTAKQLESRYRLHIVQVAGYAGAAAKANAQGPIIQPTVDAIASYIEANKLKSPKIVGHSLGGLMGLMLAAQHPKDVSKLMVVDSLPFFSVLAGATDVKQAAPRAATIRNMILAQNDQVFAWSQAAAVSSLVKSPAGRKAASAWGAATDRSVLARSMYESMTTDLRPQLPQIKTPVTVLYPWDESMGQPKQEIDQFYSENFVGLPKKTMKRIDGSLHFIMFDQPRLFAAEVLAFVK